MLWTLWLALQYLFLQEGKTISVHSSKHFAWLFHLNSFEYFIKLESRGLILQCFPILWQFKKRQLPFVVQDFGYNHIYIFQNKQSGLFFHSLSFFVLVPVQLFLKMSLASKIIFCPTCLVTGMRTCLTGDFSWMLTMHRCSITPRYLCGCLWPTRPGRRHRSARSL